MTGHPIPYRVNTASRNCNYKSKIYYLCIRKYSPALFFVRLPPGSGTQPGQRRTNGRFTEWLGGGLQNHLRRFESATDLNLIPLSEAKVGFFVFVRNRHAGLR